jgi:hypothetical protein
MQNTAHQAASFHTLSSTHTCSSTGTTPNSTAVLPRTRIRHRSSLWSRVDLSETSSFGPLPHKETLPTWKERTDRRGVSQTKQGTTSHRWHPDNVSASRQSLHALARARALQVVRYRADYSLRVSLSAILEAPYKPESGAENASCQLTRLRHDSQHLQRPLPGHDPITD